MARAMLGFVCCVLFSLSVDAAETIDVPVSDEIPGGGTPGQIIGQDDRVVSEDPRVARLVGNSYCTAWLTSAGVALTAYHCKPKTNCMCYDLMFRVPPSDNIGMPRDPELRFIFKASSVSDGGEDRPGKDWRVLRVYGNSLGENVFNVMGRFFRPRSLSPVIGENLQVTGYGRDFDPPNQSGITTYCNDKPCNAQSLTEQTDIGPVTNIDNSWVAYAVDTEKAASGGPIFLPGTDIAIGVHHGGRTEPCSSVQIANCGTLLNSPGFLAAVANVYKGASDRVIFVDSAGNTSDSIDTGAPFTPYRRLSEAMKSICPSTGCPAGQVTVLLAGGNYEGLTFTTPTHANLRLIAPAGRVTIGPVVPPFSNAQP